MSGQKPYWYAVRTAYGREPAVKSRLEAAGMAVYIPALRAPTGFEGRGGRIAEPAFHCLLFVRAETAAFIDKTAQEPVQIITNSATGFPACIGDGRMQHFMRLADNGGRLVAEDACVESFPRVRITGGLLAGTEGHGQQAGNNCRVWISLPGTGLATETDVPAHHIELLTTDIELERR